MDEEGRITGWNTQAQRTFGWTATEVIGCDLADTIIPGELRDQHRKGLKRFQQTGVRKLNGRVEIAALHRDGHVFPIEVAVAPIYSGQSVSFCAFVRDITERTHAASALCKAKEAAEAANQAKSMFLAQMNHEIRTPLNGILGFADVLQKMGPDASDEECNDYLDTINRSGRHLLGVINDVLDLSKIESGQMEVDPVRCAPHGIIADAVSILRVRAQEKGIDLRCRWEGRVPETILTDPSRFRQLLMNLIGNAIKFTDQGRVEVVARLENVEPSPRLAVDVSDTGIGIAPEHLSSIFEPFVQADGSITRRFGGTGLGLTISRQIAERLGGSLEVKSELGRGSQFMLKIGAGSLQGIRLLDAPHEDVLPSQNRAGALVDLGGASILLVEDGATNRKLVDLVLRRAGARVTTAENGKIAIELARSHAFDLILMDMQMPVMDGYVATAELRRSGLTIPILALTANAMKGDAERCAAAGCSGFLSKPIDGQRLLDGVAAALRNAATPVGGASTTSCRTPRDNAGSLEVQLTSSLPVDDPDFVEIIREFVERLGTRLAEMHRAARENDFATLAELAHWLKGSGGSAGFQALTTCGAELEEAARESDTASVVGILEALDATVARIQIPGVTTSAEPVLPS
jgi:PAS domain S-box-containing protein